MIMLKQAQTRLATRRQLPGRRTSDRQRRVNVGENERLGSIAAGALLGALGLSRWSLPGFVLAGLGGALVYRGTTGQCPMYRAMDIDTAGHQRRLHVEQAFTIDKPAEELYRFWRDLQNLPRVMTHLESVEPIGDNRSHWVVDAPAIIGGVVEWDAETVEDVTNERIAWRSLADSDVDHYGSVSFEATPRGTIVRVELAYVAPAGEVGSWVGKVFGENPEQQIREDLRDFKRLMEVGEIPTIKGQPRGTCISLGRRMFA